jgi:uncharacterized membrane protein
MSMTEPSLVQSVLDAFGDPRMRHAAIVHMPVALSVLGLPIAALAALFLGRRPAWRWATLAAYGALLVLSLLAVNSGEGAHDAITVSLPDAAYELLEEHEEMAEKAWMPIGAVLLLTAVTFVRDKRAQGACAVLALAVGVAGAGWIGVTAHHGGMLVYTWGVGTPTSEPAEPGGAGSTDARAVFFVEHVRPILEENCWRCHNAVKHRGRLDQTSIAGLLRGGMSGPAVVPGAPDLSLLMEAVLTDDEDFRMPPEGEPLTGEQVAALRQWILDGAVWH